MSFEKDLIKLKGIGKKSAKEVMELYPTLDELLCADTDDLYKNLDDRVANALTRKYDFSEPFSVNCTGKETIAIPDKIVIEKPLISPIYCNHFSCNSWLLISLADNIKTVEFPKVNYKDFKDDILELFQPVSFTNGKVAGIIKGIMHFEGSKVQFIYYAEEKRLELKH